MAPFPEVVLRIRCECKCVKCIVLMIFAFRNYRDHETWIRGHSRSLEMTPLDRSYTTFYQCSIVKFVIGLYRIGLLHRFGDTAGWAYRSGVYCTNSDKIVFKSHVSNFIYYVLVRC